MYTEQLTQRLGFGTPSHSQTLNNSTDVTGAIDMQTFHRALFALDIGAITSTGSITAILQESNDLSSWTTVAGTNVSLSLLTTASKLYTQEIRADQLTKRYVRMSITETVGQNVKTCCIAWGDEAAHKPGSALNATAVSTQNVAA